MKTSSNQEHFFETDASQATRRRKAAKAGNKHGNPITLQSKLNAVTPDPTAPYNAVLVAESAGNVRRISLESGETKTVYKGPKTPLTSVATGRIANTIVVFAGCWDKLIWSWDLLTGAPRRTYAGHADFVKTVLYATVGGAPCLISGGADKKIMVWDAESGARLHVLQDPLVPMMAVQHLALDPAASAPDAAVVVSAGSDPHIRRWRITLAEFEKLATTNEADNGADKHTILEHETGVFQLTFDTTAASGYDDVDLWTASADGTAKCLARGGGFVADETLEHGDYVRAVAVGERVVATAGRSEDVKVWDRASGQLRYVLEGHYDEVTDMVLLRDESGRREKLVSVGIDGTVRTWGLGEEELSAAVEAMEKEKGKEKEGGKEEAEVEAEKGEGMLTAEEEAELAELMSDDD